MRTLLTVLALLLGIPALAAAAPHDDLASTVASGSRPEVDQAISRLKHAGVTHERLAPVARLLSEGDARARQNAAYVFSVVPVPSFGEVLTRSLFDSDEVVRAYCATALGRIKARGAVRGLTSALGDANPVVRRESAKALGAIGDKSVARKLVGLLEDNSTEVRVAAILALGQLGDKASEKPLLPLLKNPSETLRLAAIRSLCALGNAEGKKPVEAMLASAEAGERKDGIRLLDGLKGPWVREALLAQTRDKSLDVAILAAKALASSGDGRGVQWLVHAASRVDAEAKLKIETALEDLQLTPEDRKKILAQKPGADLVLPPVAVEKGPDQP